MIQFVSQGLPGFTFLLPFIAKKTQRSTAQQKPIVQSRLARGCDQQERRRAESNDTPGISPTPAQGVNRILQDSPLLGSPAQERYTTAAA